MRGSVFGLVVLSACGRFGFTDDPRPDTTLADAGDPTLEHILIDEPGWTVEV